MPAPRLTEQEKGASRRRADHRVCRGWKGARRCSASHQCTGGAAGRV